jgi:Uncharacterised protein family UPF0547
MACFIALAGLLGGLVIMVHMCEQEANKKKARLNAAKRSYETALAQLEAAPDSVELRTAVIEAGRLYSAICREDGKGTIFDEVALSNDLAARTGKAVVTDDSPSLLKTCPDCAEEVKDAARKCRFCGYEWELAVSLPD